MDFYTAFTIFLVFVGIEIVLFTIFPPKVFPPKERSTWIIRFETFDNRKGIEGPFSSFQSAKKYSKMMYNIEPFLKFFEIEER